MTREEAIKNIKEHCYFARLRDDAKEALDMAIKALEQKPSKPMIEIDLYSVIQQAYIEREALDKIKAEIDYQQKWLLHAGYTIHNVDIALDTIKSVVAEIKEEKI